MVRAERDRGAVRGRAERVSVSGLATRSRGSGATRTGTSAERTAQLDSQSSALEEIQRSRLIAGAVCAIDELGYAQATVAHITTRASVSRRTFYELFANREECLTAVLEDVLGRIRGQLVESGIDGMPWRERVRTGLWVILSFFDHEPALARVCVVQALRAGPRVLGRREEILSSLAGVLDDGRRESARGEECTALTAEGLVGATLAIVHARLLRGEREPLTGLLGELMGMIVLPYLGSPAARREHTRPKPAPALIEATNPMYSSGAQDGGDPLRGVPMRLTYRTAKVIEGIALNPGASNRIVGQYAGVADQGQISKLLARLQRVGLLHNTGPGHAKGEPNAWTLTPRGEQVAHSIRAHVQAATEGTPR
jgi:AcrR family transcriptional regulator